MKLKLGLLASSKISNNMLTLVLFSLTQFNIAYINFSMLKSFANFSAPNRPSFNLFEF